MENPPKLPPIQVAQLDLDGPEGAVLDFGPAIGSGTEIGGGDVYALVRLRGRPVATVVCRVPPGKKAADAVAAEARALLARSAPEPPAETVPGPLPRTSVIVATRERADSLARALDSLLAQNHPDFEIIVVDNAPVTSATQDLVEQKYEGRVRYAREEVPGLAIAHNRGVAVATGEVLAFTDDDVIADANWLTALTTPFAADPALGCATGLILPAQLGTPAQILLESHGGFAKGFAPRTYDPANPPADEPMFPFTAGSFGSGANMAFRAAALRSAGGFDPATGTGTPARGGDDLFAFVSVLATGHKLRYSPEALVWHHHRETWQDLKNQAYGYGAGLTAFLTATLVRRPSLLPSLLRKLPRGLAHARTITAHRDTGDAAVPGAHGAQDYPWPRHLSRLERRGMLAGPIGYAKARRRVRGVSLPWDREEQR
ncbi:glycosyltransferase [Streptomyces albipurpureus]|uniref:Glycosyltransferase family 2 protein n=1 Tax=Streptomyces albipurpureus TaxID=2897419 RepID=A0ABT0USA0_9ACTN|nr:glycosyltransferase family 2 protein [Streptomyces sp. CWNU-1]MCM2390116.1 glycosyltransferase family 2 protein [Streptomyces sp. CWNU-1]